MAIAASGDSGRLRLHAAMSMADRMSLRDANGSIVARRAAD